VDRRVLHVYGFNFTGLDIAKSRSFGVTTKNHRLVSEAIKLFAEKIKPAEALDPKRVQRLLADLGSDAFPLMAEIGIVSLALKDLSRCDKINIAAIGNVVPQLHIHIVARRTSDPLWPKPVFGVASLARAEDAEFARFVALAKSGRPFLGNMVIGQWSDNSPALEAALKEQQRVDLERSLGYAKKKLGLGVRGRA